MKQTTVRLALFIVCSSAVSAQGVQTSIPFNGNGGFLAVGDQDFAQDSVVILSPLVGPVIDGKECDIFQLFAEYSRFDSAMVVKSAPGNYSLHFMGLATGEGKFDTSVVYDEARVRELTQQIDEVEFDRGRKIVITTNSGEVAGGELLAVRPAELVFAYAENIDDAALAYHPELLQRMPVASIRSIVIEGRSNIGKGMSTGTIVGLAAGTLIGLVCAVVMNTREEYGGGGWALGGGMILGPAAGFVGGAVIGAVLLTREITLEHPDERTIIGVRSAARYSKDEPEFLRNLR